MGGADVFDESPSLKLATAIVTRNTMFSDDIERLGHTKEFAAEPKDSTSADVGESRLSRMVLEDWEVSKFGEYVTDYPELEDVLDLDTQISEPSKSDILGWLEEEYRRSRGFELGTFDASLLTIIWKKQSKNWDKLTRGYISEIICLVHAFSMKLLSSVCPDHRVRSGLTSVLMDPLLERYKQAINHGNFILEVERAGNPLTLNHYFSDNLEKSRQKRLRDQMQSQAFDSDDHGQIIKLDSIVHTSRASNLEHTVQDIHDILHAYYKVARKRFVDVVCMQAADYHLVTGPESPARLFSPRFVSDLTPEQLEFIAGEDASTRRKRAELDREIANLEKGKKILI